VYLNGFCERLKKKSVEIDMEEIHTFLISKVKEEELVDRILFMGQPTINEDLKKDLRTFSFTWNVIEPFIASDTHCLALLSLMRESIKEYALTPIVRDSCSNDRSYIQKHLLKFNSLERLLFMKKMKLF
tara:strand:- start:6266 stop:6652 length:387 start_codon:yes stop_codon:yes gene_type:complete